MHKDLVISQDKLYAIRGFYIIPLPFADNSTLSVIAHHTLYTSICIPLSFCRICTHRSVTDVVHTSITTALDNNLPLIIIHKIKKHSHSSNVYCWRKVLYSRAEYAIGVSAWTVDSMLVNSVLPWLFFPNSILFYNYSTVHIILQLATMPDTLVI